MAGKVFVLMMMVDVFFLMLLEWWLPEERIDRCPEFRAPHLGLTKRGGEVGGGGDGEEETSMDLPEEEAKAMAELLS